jgi:hypothetical protein
MFKYLRIIEYGNDIDDEIKSNLNYKKIILFRFFYIAVPSKEIYRLKYTKIVI